MKWVDGKIGVFVLASEVQANPVEYEIEGDNFFENWYAVKYSINKIYRVKRFTNITKSGIYLRQSRINIVSIVCILLFDSANF